MHKCNRSAVAEPVWNFHFEPFLTGRLRRSSFLFACSFEMCIRNSSLRVSCSIPETIVLYIALQASPPHNSTLELLTQTHSKSHSHLGHTIHAHHVSRVGALSSLGRRVAATSDPLTHPPQKLLATIPPTHAALLPALCVVLLLLVVGVGAHFLAKLIADVVVVVVLCSAVLSCAHS